MTFEDLPTNWPELPLTTPGLAIDVVDLALLQSHRCDDTLLLLLCDDDAVALPTPISVSDMRWGASAIDRRRVCVNLATACRLAGASLVIAAVSACTPVRDARAGRWRAALDTALAAQDIELLACFSASHDEITPVLPSLRDAA